MSKRKRKKRPPLAKPRGYNVEMIQDFLEHLMWELRIRVAENRNPGMLDQELVEQLAHYQKKRNTIGLLCAVRVANDVTEEMISRFRQEQIEKDEVAISALESLKVVLEEAFSCARQPNAWIERPITTADFE